MISVLISISLLLFGIWHCRYYGHSFRLDCSKTDCVLSSYNPSKIPISSSISFPKVDLLDAEYVRIGVDGKKVDDEMLKTESNSDSHGHSISLTVRLPVSSGSAMKTEKEIIFAQRDMGRRSARTGTTRITKYINYQDPIEIEDADRSDEVTGEASEGAQSKRGESKRSSRRRRADSNSSRRRASRRDETVKLYSGRMVTATGIVSLFAGLVSLILCCIFGQWEESVRFRNGRHVKKAS